MIYKPISVDAYGFTDKSQTVVRIYTEGGGMITAKRCPTEKTFVLYKGRAFLFTHQVRVAGSKTLLRSAQRSASVSHALPLHAAVREQDMPHAHGTHMDWFKTRGLRSRSPQRRYARLEDGQSAIHHAEREYQAGENAEGAQE